MTDNHHVRFGAFLVVMGLVLSGAILLTPHFVTEFVLWVRATTVWLASEVGKAEFWQTALLMVTAWFKRSIVKSVVLAILSPLLLIVFLVALFDPKDRRLIREYKAKKLKQLRTRFRFVRRWFYQAFGYYGIFALLIAVATVVWTAFTVSWQLASLVVAWGPVREVAAQFYRLVSPVVEFVWPYLQSFFRNLYHRVPGVAQLVNLVSWIWHRLVTGWLPLVHRYQKHIGRNFIRFLVRQRWVRGHLHAQARARIQEIREARRLKTEARMLGLDPDGVPGQGWRGRNYGMRHERNARCVSDRAWARLMLGANLKPTLWEGATVCGRPPI